MHDRDALVEDLVCRCLDARVGGDPAAVDAVLAEQSAEIRDLVVAMLGTLDRVGLGGGATATATDVAAVPFGPYLLLGRLGAGSMGVVHHARDPNGREVALKLLQPGLLPVRRARLRFEREIQALRELDHPGICPILDAGEVDGVPFLVMPLLVGESLQARFARGPSVGATAQQELLAIVASLASALHHAHERGFVHRDVKPANVLVQTDGRPVVLDFGLARLDCSDAAALSMSHEVIGAPAYMAPEQIADGRAVDRRADVYALGVLLYEGLTGHCPYEAATRESLYRRILTGEMASPSQRAGHVPLALDVVCLTALAREPDRRYQTAAAFAADLVRVGAGERPLAQLPGRIERMRRWTGSNPLPTALVALLAMAVVAALWQTVQERHASARDRARALAAEAFEVLAADPDRALNLGLAAHALAPDVQEAVTAIESARATEREAFVLRDHTAAVVDLAFDDRGERLASASLDGTVRLWNLAEGTSRQLDHEGGASHVRWQPGGELVATGGRGDGRVRAWVSDSGRCVWERQVGPAGEPVRVLCWSPDGAWLLAGGAGGARLWSRAGEARELALPDGAATAGTWLDSGHVALGIRRTGITYETVSHEVLLLRLGTEGAEAFAAAPVDDELTTILPRPGAAQTLLLVDRAGKAYLWPQPGEPLRRLPKEQHRGVQGAAWAGDGSQMLTIALGGVLVFWDPDGVRRRNVQAVAATMAVVPHPRLPFAALSGGFGVVQLRSYEGMGALLLGRRRLRPEPVAISPDGRWIAACGQEHAVRIWSLWRPEAPLFFVGDGVRAATWSADGRRVLTGSMRVWGNPVTGSGVVRAWDAASGDLLQAIEVGTPVSELLIDPVRDRLVALYGSWDSGTVRTLGTGAGVLSDAGSTVGAGVLERVPIDGELLASGQVLVVEEQARVLVCDLDTGEVVHRLPVRHVEDAPGGSGYLLAVAASPDGATIWCGGASGHLHRFHRGGDGVYAAAPSEYLGECIRSLACVDDGSLLVGMANGVLQRHLPDGAVVRFVGHRADLGDLDWARVDGELLVVSGDYAGSVRLWGGDGVLRREIRAHSAAVTAVRFSPQGDRVLTAADDSTARIWPVHFDPRR